MPCFFVSADGGPANRSPPSTNAARALHQRLRRESNMIVSRQRREDIPRMGNSGYYAFADWR
jgi:hypothetical protein